MADDRSPDQHYRDDDQKRAIEAAVDLVRRDYRLEQLEAKVEQMAAMQREILAKLASIERAATLYKGGFLLIVALGGIVAWVSSVAGNIFRAIK